MVSCWDMIDAFPVNYYVTDVLEVGDDQILLVSASRISGIGPMAASGGPAIVG